MDSLKTDWYEKRLLSARFAMGLGIVALGAVLFGGCADTTNNQNASLPTGATPTATAPEAATPQISEAAASPEHTIQPNIQTGAIASVDLFGDGNQSIHQYQVNVDKGVANLTPPERDGIFFPAVAFKGANDVRVYHFGGDLVTDANGSINGDLLIQGHTNSGGAWEMNKISELKVGDTVTITFAHAIATAKITKITPIKKDKNNAVPGQKFSESFGPNGAIETCKLITDKNGHAYQSGSITVLGIVIVSLIKIPN